MTGKVLITILFAVKLEEMDRLAATLAQAFQQTRLRPGCRSIRADRHSDANKILLVEEWDSMQHYQDYLAWRASRGEQSDTLLSLLEGPPAFDCWSTNIESR